jgi:hypothetical protein
MTFPPVLRSPTLSQFIFEEIPGNEFGSSGFMMTCTSSSVFIGTLSCPQMGNNKKYRKNKMKNAYLE